MVKEDIHIEASSTPHLHVCPIIHSASTCVRDTPHSLASSYYELSSQSTQEMRLSMIKIVSTHRTLPTCPHLVCYMKTTRQVNLLKILMKHVTKMAVILRKVLKLVTTTILNPCMIYFTSQDTIFQLWKVLGRARESRNFNVCWWLCQDLATLVSFPNQIRSRFSYTIHLSAWLHST